MDKAKNVAALESQVMEDPGSGPGILLMISDEWTAP